MMVRYVVSVPDHGHYDVCHGVLYSAENDDFIVSLRYGLPYSAWSHPEIVYGQVAAYLIGVLFNDFDGGLVAAAMRYGEPEILEVRCLYPAPWFGHLGEDSVMTDIPLIDFTPWFED